MKTICAIAFLAMSSSALAERIEIVVPFGAGGSVDLLARSAEKTLEANGIETKVTNIVGTGGLTGFKKFVEADKDSTLISVGQGVMVYAPKKFPNANLTPLDHVQIVSPIYRSPEVLAARKGSPITAKFLFDPSSPKATIRIAAGGPGHEHFVSILQSHTHHKLVPFLTSSSGEAMQSVLNGDADLIADAYSFVVTNQEKLNLLGVAQAKPQKGTDSISSHLNGKEFFQWIGIAAPKGMTTVKVATVKTLLAKPNAMDTPWIRGWEAVTVDSATFINQVKTE